jgi:predicted transposase
MLQSLLIRLETSKQEKVLLLETMKQYNKATNFLSEKAFELNIANKYELQKLFYREIREQFSLSAQFAIRVISKVVEAYRKTRVENHLSGSLEQYSTTSATFLGRDLTEFLSLRLKGGSNFLLWLESTRKQEPTVRQTSCTETVLSFLLPSRIFPKKMSVMQ